VWNKVPTCYRNVTRRSSSERVLSTRILLFTEKTNKTKKTTHRCKTKCSFRPESKTEFIQILHFTRNARCILIRYEWGSLPRRPPTLEIPVEVEADRRRSSNVYSCLYYIRLKSELFTLFRTKFTKYRWTHVFWRTCNNCSC